MDDTMLIGKSYANSCTIYAGHKYSLCVYNYDYGYAYTLPSFIQ
jgi:hypothetical protein